MQAALRNRLPIGDVDQWLVTPDNATEVDKQFAAMHGKENGKETTTAGTYRYLSIEGVNGPTRYYCGRVEANNNNKWEAVLENSGHLGALDTPSNPRLLGQHLFSEVP